MDQPMSWDLRATFDFSRAISHGWEALKRQPIGLLLGAFLMSITEGGGGGGGGGGSDQENGDWNFGGSIDHLGQVLSPSDLLGQAGAPFDQLGGLGVGLAAGLVGCMICCGILAFLFRSWLEPGYIRLQRDVVVNGSGEIGALFSGGDAFLNMLLWKLLSGVIGLGTLAFALLPGGALAAAGYFAGENTALMVAGAALAVLVALPAVIYVGLGLTLGNYAVALDGLKPVDALERSWSMARNNRVHLFVFLFVTGLFWILGILLCCVGIIATRAIRDVGVTEAYLLATRPDEAPTFALARLHEQGI